MLEQSIQIQVVSGSQEGIRILRLAGPLSIHTIFAFHDAVRAEPPPALIIDFSGVPFIDSAGLGALVAANIAGQKAERKLALIGLNAQVRALLDMTRVAQLFKIYATVNEAETALSSES